MSDTCSVPDCKKPVKSGGWCSAHYERKRKYGNPTSGKGSPGDSLKFVDAILSRRSDDCIDWPFAKDVTGRGRVWADGRLWLASRYVCTRAHGEPPTKEHEAAHSCGMGHKGCVNPHHLRWATRAQNAADKLKHGTQLCGERHYWAKLSEVDVAEIRKRLAAGEMQSAIASDYGVSQSNISLIATKKLWRPER